LLLLNNILIDDSSVAMQPPDAEPSDSVWPELSLEKLYDHLLMSASRDGHLLSPAG
jgi:hypothetical protein